MLAADEYATKDLCYSSYLAQILHEENGHRSYEFIFVFVYTPPSFSDIVTRFGTKGLEFKIL